MPPSMAGAGIVFLTGFMGTGKTVVGRELARQLGRSFVDTDAEIERRAGMTISRIFEERGEASFRMLEREAIEEACRQTGTVVATGGGAVVDLENRRRMESVGRIVCLEASPEVILERVGTDGCRPLLAGASDPLARIRELLERRAPAYQAVAVRIDTSRGMPSEIAETIRRRLGDAV